MADANPFAQFVQPDTGAPAAADTAANPFAQFVQSDSAPPRSATETAIDVAKQIPAGLAKGVVNLPTAIPRILGAVGPAVNSGMEKLVGMVSPSKAADMHQAAIEEEARGKLVQDYVEQHHPGGISGDLGLPKPQTPAGQFTETASEFVPGMMGAPGNLLRNAGVGVASGLASESAGQATQGTPLEPYARVAGGAVGGVLGAGRAAENTAALTPQKVIEAGSKAFESPVVKNVLIAPGRGQQISDNIIGELDKARMNNRLAPQTRAIVEDHATPIGGALHSIEDYQTTRELLSKVAGNYNNPIEQAAASKAIASLDNQWKAIPQSDVVAGDIGAANATLQEGRANYAAGKAAERVQNKVDAAELKQNVDSATRKKLEPFLTNKKMARGLLPEESEKIDQVVRGSPVGNTVSALGSALGGKGGIGTMISAAEGMHVLGPVGAAVPVVGYGIKKLGDLITTRAAKEAVQNILNRAPAAANVPSGPSVVPGQLARALAGAKTGALGAIGAPNGPQPIRSLTQLPSQ